MRITRLKLLLPLALAGVAAGALLVVGGGSAAPQRAFGGSVSPTHFQNNIVSNLGATTKLFPDGGIASIHTGLAITSLTIDNPSSSKVVAGLHVHANCDASGGSVVLTRVVIPAEDTVHLEYAGEPLLAFSTPNARIDSGWCLEVSADGTGVNVFATIVGYTYKA